MSRAQPIEACPRANPGLDRPSSNPVRACSPSSPSNSSSSPSLPSPSSCTTASFIRILYSPPSSTEPPFFQTQPATPASSPSRPFKPTLKHLPGSRPQAPQTPSINWLLIPKVTPLGSFRLSKQYASFLPLDAFPSSFFLPQCHLVDTANEHLVLHVPYPGGTPFALGYSLDSVPSHGKCPPGWASSPTIALPRNLTITVSIPNRPPLFVVTLIMSDHPSSR